MDSRYNLNRLAYFVATIDGGTITAAAAHLRISKAVVSKQLQLLEQEVGTALLLRNTRHLQPTETGLEFYKEAKSIITQANNAFERIEERDKKPKGRIRITTPVDYGLNCVAPFLAGFRETYPDVKIDLHLSDTQVDIIEERFDVAFRIGWLKDSSNLTRKLQDFEEIAICSSQTYEIANPKTPHELSNIPFVRSHSFTDKNEWVFEKGKRSETVSMNVMCEMNMTLAMRSFVEKGYSFTILSDFMLHDELENGRLVRLLPDWSLRKGGIYTVTAPNRVRSNALQRFLELVHSEFGLRR